MIDIVIILVKNIHKKKKHLDMMAKKKLKNPTNQSSLSIILNFK